MSSGLPLVDFHGLAHDGTGYLEQNRSGRVRPYFRPVRLHEGVERSFLFLSVSWDMSKYRFLWY